MFGLRGLRRKSTIFHHFPAPVTWGEAHASDAKRIQNDLACTLVGMSHIKQRRLHEIEVGCHPGTYVGEYAPFYFCPRSIMLYILDRGNHPEISYTGGQRPMVHLEADLHECIKYAEAEAIRWACSTRNASVKYEPAMFFNNIAGLDRLHWSSIGAKIWTDPQVKDRKQAEFLMYDSFPWHLIRRIGVYDQERRSAVTRLLTGVGHAPKVIVKRDWYY